MRRWQKISLICLAVIVGLMLLSMLVVPWQLKKQGTNWIAQNTDRTLSIEKAYFNPFTLTVEVDGVKLSEQNTAAPFVSFSRLTLSVSSRSLIDWALILDRVELDDPFVNIARLSREEFNFSDFTRLGGDNPEQEDKTAEKEDKPLHFSLNNIVIRNGSLDFHDQASERESHHQVRQFDLSVPFIGNVPYLADVYVKPALFMFLNGAEVKATGELKPFHDSLETNLDVSFHGIKLPFYAEQSPLALPLRVEDGDIDFHLGLSYLVSASEEPQLLINGEFAMSDLVLKQLDGSDLFSMETLIIDLEEANIFKQQAHFLAIDIYTPELSVEHDADGLWTWQKLLPDSTPAAENSASSEETSAAQLPQVLIDSFAIHEGSIRYRDDTVPEGFNEDVEQINLTLTQLSTYPEQQTLAELKLLTGRKAQLGVSGDFTITPLQANVDVLLNGIALEPFYPYLAGQLTAPLKGTVNLGGHIRYTLDGNVLAEQIQVGLHDFRAPFGEQDYFSLPLLSLTGSSFDLNGQSIKLGELILQQGDAQITRLADGSVSPLLLIKPQPESSAEPQQVKQTNENTWQLNLAQLKLDAFKLKFTDETDSRTPVVSVPEFNLSAADLSYPKAQLAPFSINARIGKKGTVAVRGKVRHTPLQLNATTDIKAFPLADFNDFIPPDLNLKLKDGKLYTTLKTAVSQQDNNLLGDFSGGLNVSDFNLRDPLGSGEMLSWKNLNLNSIEGTLNPFALRIKELTLSDYLANITINEEGRINLTGLTAEEDSNEAEPGAEQKAEPVVAEEKGAGPAPDIRIDALTLQGGTVSFIDRHMPSTFATTMYQLGGRISGMTSDPEMQADVDLRGQLENHSPLSITGKLNPLSRDLFADLTLSFKDIDLTPMSPYSGTYVGYIIAKGKLNLDLDYHIEHQQIDADNRVMIDQFTFGDRVESDKATSLPVGLAIALLKDKNDEIHLDIPISGNLNDPKFSIAGAVWTIVRNLLVKAATSPFALLSALGGGDQDFSSVDFANGVATLDDKQLEKLQSLAKMLSDRPGLTLEITGFADADNDPEAYRQAQLQRMISQAKFAELADEGKTPESISDVTVSAEEYPDYLLQVYKDAEFPRPRNVIGMLKDLPDEEMEKLLLANIIAGEEQIAGLAKNRALRVRNTLEELNPELKPRLFLKSGDIYQKPETGPASRVEFSISAK